jgi:hypothetical protein
VWIARRQGGAGVVQLLLIIRPNAEGIVATEAVAEACNAIALTSSSFDDREDIIRGIIGGDRSLGLIVNVK